MLTRRTLNGRAPRTLRDASRDPYDWIDGPHKPMTVRAERVMAWMFGACVVAWVVLHIASLIGGGNG